jgi:hypothetical protein
MTDRVTENAVAVTLLDGKQYFVRKLSLAQYKTLAPQFERFEQLDASKTLSAETIDALIDVCYQILKPSHFLLTRRKLGQILDGQLALTVINAAANTKEVESGKDTP